MSHIPFHTCGFVSERATQREPVWLSGPACRSPRGHNCLWTSDPESLVYTGPQRVCSARAFRLSTSREADLPAQRSPPEAQARFSRPDVDACRSRDPEAAPRPWPQASLGLGAPPTCSAATASRDRGTSMRSIVAAGPCLLAFSRSIGSRAKRRAASRDLGFQCRRRRSRELLRGIESSAGYARFGELDWRRCLPAATTS